MLVRHFGTPLLIWLISCSSCRACIHVFVQHPAPDLGLCNIQQLVANVISSDVCSGADALSFLWRWIHSVPHQSRRRRLDRCSQVLNRRVCSGEYGHSHHSEACRPNRKWSNVHRIHFLLHLRVHGPLLPPCHPR